jgi:hypothetical protein
MVILPACYQIARHKATILTVRPDFRIIALLQDNINERRQIDPARFGVTLLCPGLPFSYFFIN